MEESFVLPLSPQQMVDFFKDKDRVFLINYEESLKNFQTPRFLLMYVANLGLVCNVDKITDELLAEYMVMKEFADIVNLRRAHANVVYVGKYESSLLYVDDEWIELFPYDRVVQFIQDHPVLVLAHMSFLNSLPLYALTRIESTNREDLSSKVVEGTIDELGFSLLHLLSLKDFLMMYLQQNVPLEDQLYFSRYFDEYMYGGKNLFAYFENPNNLFYGALLLTYSSLTGDEESKATLDSMTTELDSLLAKADKVSEAEGVQTQQ